MPDRALGKIFRDREIIFRQGEAADRVYAIVSGKVVVYRESDGKEVRLAELGEGDIVGELGFSRDRARTTSARSSGETRVISIDTRFVLNKFKEDPSFAFRLLEAMARQIKTKDDELCARASERRPYHEGERRRWRFFRRIQPLVEGFPGVVLLHHLAGNEHYVNRYFRERLGDPGERPLRKLPSALEELVAGWEDDSTGATHVLSSWEGEFPDGRFYQVYALPFIEEDGSRLALIAGMDVTESRELERALQRRSHRQKTTTELGALVLSGIDPSGVMHEIVNAAAFHLDAELACVMELLPDRPGLAVRAGVGFPEGGEAGVGATSQMGYALQSPAGVLIVDDLGIETRFSPARICLENGAISGLNVVIGGPDEKPFGVLAVCTRTRRVFSVDDVEFLKSLANILQTSIFRTRSEEQLDRYHRHLEDLVSERTAALSEANRRLTLEIADHRRAMEQLREQALRLEAARRQIQDSLSREQAARTEAETGKRMLEALMEYMPEGIAIAEVPGTIFRIVSRSGIEIGIPSRGTVSTDGVGSAGKLEVLEGDGETPVEENDLPLHRAMRLGEVIRGVELTLRKPDGTRVPILASAGPIRNANGGIIGAVVAWRDITERKRAEATLAYLASFPERNPNPIVEVGPSGRCSYVNPAAARLFPGLRDADWTHPWLAGLESEIPSIRRGSPGEAYRCIAIDDRSYHRSFHFVKETQCIRIYGTEIPGRIRTGGP